MTHIAWFVQYIITIFRQGPCYDNCFTQSKLFAEATDGREYIN